jgi:hypothetical protein
MKKILPICVLLVAVSLNAQTPTTCGLADAKSDTFCVSVVAMGYTVPVAQRITGDLQVGGAASLLEAGTISSIWAQFAADEAKEGTDVAALQTSIQSAFQAALAKDANSLETCPTGQTCSFTIPASDISGQFKADLTNGPTQPSADPTFTRKAGWMQPGEELYYTQYVPLAGLYTLSAAVASVATTSCPATQAGSFHINVAGKRAFPADGSSVPVPRTATWSSYQTLMPGQVQLPGGIVKFAFVNDSAAPSCFDLLWLGFAK